MIYDYIENISVSQRTPKKLTHNLKVVGSNPTPATNHSNGLALTTLGRYCVRVSNR